MMLIASLALAADLHVEAGGLSFEDAFAAAADGDRIVVHGAHVVPSFEMADKDLLVEGADPGATLTMEDELVVNDAEVEFQHITFSGSPVRCLTVYGDADVTLLDVRFEGCRSGADGGALAVDASQLTATFSHFVDNSTTADGGGAYCNNATCSFVDCLFDANDATGKGGGLRAGGSATVDVQRSRFCHNDAGDDGGAVFGTGGTDVGLIHSLFLSNDSEGAAGAAQLDGGFAIEGSTFLANTASSAPGQVDLQGASSLFTGNLMGGGNASMSPLTLQNTAATDVLGFALGALPGHVTLQSLSPAPSIPTDCEWQGARIANGQPYGVERGLGDDVDMDGVPLPGDCDDTTSAVSPLQEEVCDGRDQDCDGQIDELGCARCRAVEAGGSVYQICDVAAADRDAAAAWCENLGEGYGLIDVDDTADTDLLSEQGDQTLYVAATYVDGAWLDGEGAPQVPAPAGFDACGYWQNVLVSRTCDTPTDLVICERCAGAPPFYVDGDGDGFGAAPATTCVFGPGLSLAPGDCDDVEPGVSPLADEVPCNGVDDDCSSATPDALDGDGDGVDSCSDCDDEDPNVGAEPCPDDTGDIGHTGAGTVPGDDDDDDAPTPTDPPCDEGDTGCEPALVPGSVAPGCRCDGSGSPLGLLPLPLLLALVRRR